MDEVDGFMGSLSLLSWLPKSQPWSGGRCVPFPSAMASFLQTTSSGGFAAAVNVCHHYRQQQHCPNNNDYESNQTAAAAAAAARTEHQPNQLIPFSCARRRLAVLICSATVPLMTMTSTIFLPPLPSEAARERRTKKTIPLEDYLTSPEGLKYYDVVVGKGPTAGKGSTVQVHFDCIYRGITAVSSRESKILAGNRIIAQPYEFKVGSAPGKERKREFVDNPNGLFSAQAAPKPPPAMYTITEGMRVGGKRTVIVTPEVGYGKQGMSEIPAGATFDLNIELLQLIPPPAQGK